MGNRERGRVKFQRYKSVLILLIKFYSFFPRRARMKMFERKRGSRGKYGLAVRYALLRSLAQSCGENVAIFPNCFILHPEKLAIGDNVSIQPMCYIDAAGGIRIGNDISIAHGVTIMSSTHRYDRTDLPIRNQGIEFAETEIQDNAWIGAKATILYGKRIGKGAVVGANSVVTKDIAPFTVNAGVPARFIKKIGEG